MLEAVCSINSNNMNYQALVLNKKHLQQFKIASLSCRGLSSISKRERIIHLMSKEKIDILCLQETKINHNSQKTHQKCTFYWSTGIPDDARNKATELARSGKASRKNPIHGVVFRRAIEHAGVGVVLSPCAIKYMVSVQPNSGRKIRVSLNMQAGRFDVISTYGSQACHVNPDLANQHHEELQSFLDDRYTYSPKLICGDFNARIIKALPHESCAAGQFTLRAEIYDFDYLSPAQFENRSRMMECCMANGFVVSNTFFQKSDEQLVTYKAADVKDWSAP